MREGSAGAAVIEKPTKANQRVGGLGVRKARAKALVYCDKCAELRTCGGTVADTCYRDSTRQISADQKCIKSIQKNLKAYKKHTKHGESTY